MRYPATIIYLFGNTEDQPFRKISEVIEIKSKTCLKVPTGKMV